MMSISLSFRCVSGYRPDISGSLSCVILKFQGASPNICEFSGVLEPQSFSVYCQGLKDCTCLMEGIPFISHILHILLFLNYIT